MKELRKTGLDFLGEVPWRTHICLFHHTTEELLEVLVPFFKAGLESNECCLWVVDESLGAAAAKEALAQAVPDVERHLAAGDLHVVPNAEWYCRDGVFSRQACVERLLEKCNEALARGCAGLRASGDPSASADRLSSECVAYEEELDRSLGDFRAIVVCSFVLDKLAAPDLLAVFRNHKIGVVRKGGSWQAIASTGRLRAEESLRKSEEKYRLVSENIPVAVYSALPDEHSTSLLVSGRIEDLSGYASRQFLDDPGLWERILHPADREHVRRELQKHREAGSILDVEYRIICRDGSTKWIRDRATPALDEDGKLVRIDGYMEDVTDRKRAEESRLASEARHEMLLRTAMDGFWLADAQGRLLEVNEAYCRMSGYSERELLAMSISDLEVVETPADTAAHIQRIVAEGEDRFESRHRRKDGSTFDAEVSVQYKDIDGMRCAAFLRDITDRKRVEEDLLAANARLADAVAQAEELAIHAGRYVDDSPVRRHGARAGHCPTPGQGPGRRD